MITVCLLGGALQVMLGSAPVQAGLATTPLTVAVVAYPGDSVGTSSTASALGGADVTYEATASNGSPQDQTNVVVPVTLPPAFTINAATITPSAGTTALAGGILTWTIPTLPAGGSATLVYTEATDAPAAFESDATTASATSDQGSAPGADAPLEVVPATDLSISIDDGTDTVTPGALDAYTIALQNLGPTAVTGAAVNGFVSGGFVAIVSVSSVGGTTFANVGSGGYSWTGIDLAPGSEADLTLVGNVPSTLTGGQALVNMAAVSLPPGIVDTDAQSSAIDADSVTGPVTTTPLAVAVAAYPGDSVGTSATASALAGSDVTDEVTVSNGSTQDQTNVAVPVTLPPAFTLHAATITPSAGTTSLAGGILTWTIPTLPAGGSATLAYTETTDAPASFESDATTASVTSDQGTAPATTLALEVVPATDLSVNINDGTDAVTPGSAVTYSVIVTNAGPSPATNATVSSVVNGGFALAGATSSVGGTSFTNQGGSQFEWTGVNVGAGASATFTLTGTVSSSSSPGSVVVNVAGVTASPTEVQTSSARTAVDADTVALVPQVIDFVAPDSGVTGQTVTLSATGGTSSNPVVFSVDPSTAAGVCNVSGTNGSALSYGAPGTCVIDANQNGDLSHAPAPTVTADISVGQPPTFTQDSPPTSLTAGQAYGYSFAAKGSPTPAYGLASGAPSWLTLDPVSGTLSGMPPAGTSSFSYSVVASNFAGSANAGPFDVSVAPSSPNADVSAALSCPTSVPVRSTTTCTLTIGNAGPSAAMGLVAGLALPHGSNKIVSTGGAFWFGDNAMWFVGTLSAGSSTPFSVSFRPNVSGSSEVSGIAFALTPDPNHADNIAVDRLLVTN